MNMVMVMDMDTERRRKVIRKSTPRKLNRSQNPNGRRARRRLPKERANQRLVTKSNKIPLAPSQPINRPVKVRRMRCVEESRS
jgi:hypothetical protein